MYNIKKLNEISPCALKELNENYNMSADVENPDGIMLRSFNMHEYEIGSNLLAVARAGAGVNNIPIQKMTEKGVAVFNTPGANANAVKELVICGLLISARKVYPAMEWVQTLKGEGDAVPKLVEQGKSRFSGPELIGKKLGVVGLGAIGVKVANFARHFGMQVYGYDPYISVNAAWNLSRNVRHVGNVEDIYRECDYITIHVPLLDATRKMINEEAIALMKPDAVILNFARDLLVDEEAVVAALAEGRLKKYVSDFPNQTTAGKKGCLVIPHLGASTEESEDNCAVMAAQEIRNYLENGNIRNSVNYPNCDMGECTTEGRVAVLHKNSKGVIGKFTSIFGECDINIANMTNKSKGDYAYSMFDLDAPMTEEAVLKMKEMKGVFKVRIVK